MTKARFYIKDKLLQGLRGRGAEPHNGEDIKFRFKWNCNQFSRWKRRSEIRRREEMKEGFDKLPEMKRRVYKTLFLFAKKKTCAKRKMNRKFYIMGKTSVLHSSVSTIGWERGKGKGGALDK